MSTIPTSLTEEQFKEHIQPYLRTAQRGYVSKIALYKVFNYMLYRLHTGCQWHQLPIVQDANAPERKEISWWAVYYHFRKWSRDGSLKRLWQHSVQFIKDKLDLTVLNMDGSHAIAKKGGQAVAYQGRKKAKTSNILPIIDHNGYIVATTEIVSGNHNDAFELKAQLQIAFKAIKRLGLPIADAYFNADAAFDTLEARKVCFNHRVRPNIPYNKRNRKATKLGRKRLFDALIYKERFASERTFAWIDKFRALLIRFEINKIYFMGNHYLAFTLINLRNSLVP
jgi:transposase